VENAGLELSAPYYRGWKMRDWNNSVDVYATIINTMITEKICNCDNNSPDVSWLVIYKKTKALYT